MSSELPQLAVIRKQGIEPFHEGREPLPFALSDFWSWAFSDLVANTTRGLIAEYLVARALDADQGCRTEWDAWDVVTPDGIKVEVKSSAYIQSWGIKQGQAICRETIHSRILG